MKVKSKTCKRCKDWCGCHKFDHLSELFKNNQRPIYCLWCNGGMSPQKQIELRDEFIK